MRRLFLVLCLFVVVTVLLGAPGRAADMQFTTSDGVRLHVIEAGPKGAPTIVFVPGWTMPAWIFMPQIEYFSQRFHVVALDPRGQGDSEAPAGGYDYARRGRDIADLLGAVRGGPVLLVGWSLGVLDSLAYVHEYGDAALAGLVLIDNSVGENPPPVAARGLPVRRGPPVAVEEARRRFVAGMFRRSPGAAYLEALTQASLATPAYAAAALANYAVPRSYWREAVLGVRRPILYVVRPRFAAQAANLQADNPLAEYEVFDEAGHALFVDEAERFDRMMAQFIGRRVWR